VAGTGRRRRDTVRDPDPGRRPAYVPRVRHVLNGEQRMFHFLLWLLAVILVVAGIFQLFKRNILLGIALIVVGFLVGPGGVSIFK
jgi:hypothetical protein